MEPAQRHSGPGRPRVPEAAGRRCAGAPHSKLEHFAGAAARRAGYSGVRSATVGPVARGNARIGGDTGINVAQARKLTDREVRKTLHQIFKRGPS